MYDFRRWLNGCGGDSEREWGEAHHGGGDEAGEPATTTIRLAA